MNCMRLLLIFALLAAMIPSAAAGRVKGVKGLNPTAGERNLKEKGDGKLPKVKKQGPQARTCKTSAKADKVEFQCRTRNGNPVAPKAKGEELGVKEVHHKESPKEGPLAKESPKEGPLPKEGPQARTIEGEDLVEEVTRGISLTPSELIEDEIKYVVKTSKQGIQVSIEYKQVVETELSENKTETEFDLQFESLVEYVKGQQTQRWGFSNGVSTEAYDWNTDEIVQVIPLKNWNAIPGIISDAGGVVSYFTASAALSSPGVAIGPTGTTHFNFTVSEEDLGKHITANSMKIDVRILDFPWQRSDSYVALMSTVDSKKRIQLEHDDEALVSGGKSKLTQDVYITFDEEMQSLGLEAFGEYTWENNAQATNADDTNMVVERGGSRRAQQDGIDEAAAVVEDVSAHPGGGPPGPAGGELPPGQPTVNAETNIAGSTNTIQVIATSPEEPATENHQEIAYSFVGDAAHSAAEIYWDPEAGIGYGEAPVSSVLPVQSYRVAVALLSTVLYTML